MKLYKYYSQYEYLKETILDNTIYFGDVKEFNDPYEEDAVFRNKKDRKLYGLFADTSKNMKSKSKICCFSKTPNNYILWSYYANKHKGFCVEFDFKNVTNLNFGFCKTSMFRHQIVFGEIDYNNPIIEFDEFPSHELFDEQYLQFFYKKYDYWKHEEEIRALLMSDNSIKVKIPNTYIKSIILGCKCDDDKKVEMLIKSCKRKVPITKTFISYQEKTVKIATTK